MISATTTLMDLALTDPALMFQKNESTANQKESVSNQSEKSPLRLKARPTLKNLSEQLLNLMEVNQLARDELSQDLQAWIREVSQLMFDEPRNIHVLLARKINELQRKILVNPMDRAPLKIPVLASGRLWEEWMLIHYQQLCRFSPYDGLPIGPKQEHSFAKSMITFLGEVLGSPDLDPALSLLPQELETIENERERRVQELQEQLDVEQDPEKQDVLINEKQALGPSKKQYVNEEEAKEAYQCEVLEDYQIIAQNTIRIEEAKNEIAHVQKLKEKLLQEMRLTEEAIQRNISRVNEVLVEIEQSNKENLEAVIKSCDEQIKARNEVIAQAHEDIQGLKGRVTELEGASQILRARVDAHDRTIAAQSAEIRHLRWEVANMDDDGCTIM